MRASRAHYQGNFNRIARAVCQAAYADPSTLCECGRTLSEHPNTGTGKPPTWDADHIYPGVIGSPLRARVSSCNRAAGAVLGNQRRRGLRTSRQW